jgi:hypothetical protein
MLIPTNILPFSEEFSYASHSVHPDFSRTVELKSLIFQVLLPVETEKKMW